MGKTVLCIKGLIFSENCLIHLR